MSTWVDVELTLKVKVLVEVEGSTALFDKAKSRIFEEMPTLDTLDEGGVASSYLMHVLGTSESRDDFQNDEEYGHILEL